MGVAFENGGACELNGTRELVGVDVGIVDVKGGNGYCVLTKAAPSSSFGLESLGGMEIGPGMGMGFERDGMLVITRYTKLVSSLPPPYGCRVSGLRH